MNQVAVERIEPTSLTEYVGVSQDRIVILLQSSNHRTS